MNFEFLRRKELAWFIVLLAIFAVLRLPAIHSPYHQDEYKWVQYAHPEITLPGTVPHPPLTEFIYAKTLGPLLGDSNFRFIPLIFSVANLFLIFYLAKIIFDPLDKLRASKTAFWTAFLFVTSFYSVLASLMVDVDGAIMPMFFLIMAIGYFKLKTSGFELREGNWKWLVLLIVGAVGGFLIKVSAVLPICALALDFAIEKGAFRDKRKIIKYIVFSFLGAVSLVAVLFLARFVFPFFNLEYSFNYWKHFANSSGFFDRGWLQTFIQFVKAILYTSPLLLLPAFFIDKEIWRKLRPFFFFIFIGLMFYLFVFDFSIGALDRYFQFLVVPLCIISGAVFAKIFRNKEIKLKKEDFITVFIITISIFALQFFNHTVPPLYPKTEWLSRLLSLEWNFLFPFTGGSGPLGFYISFIFMALSYICSAVLAVAICIKKELKHKVFAVILIIGLVYNFSFIEEYLFGKINGSAPKLLYDVTEFIKNDPDIKAVTVYNDNGGYEIMKIGKYRRRLYTSPAFDVNQKISTLNATKDYYLEINIPRIDPNSVFRKYFDSCNVAYRETDKSISATVYDCRNAPDIKN
ncbi:MAG: hypothetical protein V1896_00945 [Candidatus Zambryskibacteria bacterium]